MSIALDIGAEFIRRIGCLPIYDSPEIEEEPSPPSDSSSSSIGKDSDDLSSESGDDASSGMKSMEESLPIRRGISSFYAGKAKSFTGLSEAATVCASAKDLAKAENAYTRRRRNLLASKISCEKHHYNLLRSPVGGIAKRTGSFKRSHLALVAAMNSSPRSNNGGEHEDDNSRFSPSVSQRGKPEVVEDSVVCSSSSSSSSSQVCSFSMRSFSLGDLPVLRNLRSSVGPNGEK